MAPPPCFPVETWEAIFRHVTRPGDLYNLCLASRYICDIASPILYAELVLDQNPFLVFTLARLRREPPAALLARVTRLTLLPTVQRALPRDMYPEVDALWQSMDMLPATRPYPHAFYPPVRSTATAADAPAADHRLDPAPDPPPSPPNMIYYFPDVFASLTTLTLLGGSLPPHFLSYIFTLPRLATLHIHDATIPPELQPALPPAPLALRELVVRGCKTKSDRLEVATFLAKGLLQRAPRLAALTVDLFLELAAFIVLAHHERPPPIRVLNCQGLSNHQADCAIMCSVLTALPTITTLHMARTPRELSHLLPPSCLPNLHTLTGQIKSLVVYTTYLRRRLQYLTITDAAVAPPSGAVPWETHLIHFLETLKRTGAADLKGIAFNVAEWSEELFLCVCHLWPGLKELRIQCTAGDGVDEYFRISFGPRFLPQLSSLEVLQIFGKRLKHGFTRCRLSKGVHVYTDPPAAAAALQALSADERDELAETPVHLRRWERLNPNLRMVAFDRESWWRRVHPGNWVLRRDALPMLIEE